jgi:hypothetical protein
LADQILLAHQAVAGMPAQEAAPEAPQANQQSDQGDQGRSGGRGVDPGTPSNGLGWAGLIQGEVQRWRAAVIPTTRSRHRTIPPASEPARKRARRPRPHQRMRRLRVSGAGAAAPPTPIRTGGLEGRTGGDAEHAYYSHRLRPDPPCLGSSSLRRAAQPSQNPFHPHRLRRPNHLPSHHPPSHSRPPRPLPARS